MITIDPISLESEYAVDKVFYRWTFRNLHNRVGIGEEIESENKFLENQNFEQCFWSENL